MNPDAGHVGQSFHHAALLYRGRAEFVELVGRYVAEGIDNGDRVLVVTSRAQIEALGAVVGPSNTDLRYEDMTRVGANPALIIAAWREFVDGRNSDERGLRGVGEPIWPGRSDAEIIECQLHESLLNRAFADSQRFNLLCPYDAGALPADVIEEARHSHPYLGDGMAAEASPDFDPTIRVFSNDLPPPIGAVDSIRFHPAEQRAVRSWLEVRLAQTGMGPERASELVLAVHEVVVNSMSHGGGSGTLLFWREDGKILCQIEDGGSVDDPLVGRRAPDLMAPRGRGLWLVNHLCDLVQIRSQPSGTVVRLHKSI